MDAKHNRTIAEVAMGYKQPLDRSDRAMLDYKKFVTLFLGKDTFFDDIITVSNKLNFEPQNPKEDLNKPYLLLGQYFHQINSTLVKSMKPKERVIFDNAIHKLLVKKKLSYNFYPLIEYILLYQDLPPNKLYLFQPNPRMFQLYTEKRPLEFVRNYHTTSDRKFFMHQAKLAYSIYGKPTKEERKTLDFYEELISVNKNKERVRNINDFNDDFERLVHEYKSIPIDKKLTMKDVSDSQLYSKNPDDDFPEIEKNEKRLRSLKKRLENKKII